MEYIDLTLTELREIAKQKGLKNISKYKKMFSDDNVTGDISYKLSSYKSSLRCF